MPDVQLDPLPPEVAARLTAFARACKGAARAAGLYPPEHPAVAEALSRLVDAVGTATEAGPLTLLVIPDDLLVDGRSLERHDLAVSELAAILHAHRVGEVTIQPDVPPASWRTLMTLLGQDPDRVRLRGGIARALTTAGALGVSVSEIDYSSLFDGDSAASRRRLDADGGRRAAEAAWAAVVERCLEGKAPGLDEATLRLLGEVVHDPDRVAEFFERVESESANRTTAELCDTLLGTMEQVIAFLKQQAPDEVDTALSNMAAAFASLSPEFVLEVVGTGGAEGSAHAPLVTDLAGRIGDRTLARFISRSVAHERHASARLSDAVRLLAPEPARRKAIAPLVHEELAHTQVCEETSFDSLWSQVADMLTTYSDTPFVSTSYDRELTTARHRATDLSQGFDDPPERVIGWLKTVGDVAVRECDLQMLADLLAVQQVDDRRRDAVGLVMDQIGDLADLGDFEGARRLVDAAVSRRESPRVEGAADTVGEALDALARGAFVSRVASHLQAARDSEFEHVRAMCVAIGPALAPAIVEALAVEDRPRARRRLADLMMALGSHGGESIQQLVESPNPGVRQTAAQLLRLRGGADSVPDLTRLAADPDPGVQREAARGIIGLGIDESFDALRGILSDRAHPGRRSMVDELATTRDRGAAQLLCHLVQHLECRGELRPVYLQSIARLGALGGQDAVDALAEILNRGQWWAPFRTREIRATAAAALAQIPLPSAREALAKAAASETLGVRAAARRHLRQP
jgi:hypothetical protein